MAKPQPAQPPNPVTTAQAQTGTNIGTAIAQSELGNVNQTGPYGSTTFTQNGGYTDPTTGQFVPQWSQNTSLNPLAQSILTGTEQAGNMLVPTAQNLATQAGGTATTPLDVNQTANNAIIAGGPQALDPTVARAAYNASTAFLTPTFQQQQKDLQDQLARQGISVGNDAYSNAENQLFNTQNNALTAAANNAVVSGANQANNIFGLALQGQGQNIGQQQAVQQNPLRLLSMLYGGAGTSPMTA